MAHYRKSIQTPSSLLMVRRIADDSGMSIPREAFHDADAGTETAPKISDDMRW
jgi:hypothetical protein